MQTLRPVHANIGAIAKYRRQLQDAIKEMSDSYLYWLTAAYNKNQPINLAADLLPSADAQKKLDELKRKWRHKFELLALYLALMHITRVAHITDNALMSALAAAGISATFKETRAIKDILNASVEENTSLIESIQEQYHTRIEGIVMRGYSMGSSLDVIRKEMKKAQAITERRAGTIAGDQISKINSMVQSARLLEVGITHATWFHSHKGVPRPDHLAADGRVYEIAEGCLISGEYLQPGQLINCRCVGRGILN